MTIDSRAHVSGLLRFVRSCSHSVLNGLPEDKYCFQSSPTDNHALWCMGHLALTDAWIAREAGIPGVSVPKDWEALFGRGSKPHPDAGRYPPVAEVRGVFDATHAAVLNWAEGASEQQLTRSLKEQTGGFAADVIDGLYKLAWHEGWHFGQVASIRKALDLPGVFGG